MSGKRGVFIIICIEEIRWRSSRSIRKMFGKKKISEKEWKYVDNLELYVFEMRRLQKETRELFESDMRIVVDFLAEGNGYRSDRKVVHKAALIKMIKVLSGNTDVDDIEDWLEEQESERRTRLRCANYLTNTSGKEEAKARPDAL